MTRSFVFAEQSLSTSSLVLASIFLVCRAVLRNPLPLSWDDIYSCMDAYLDGTRRERRITFHFQKTGVPAGKIYAACLALDTEEKFVQALEGGAPLPVLQEAHSRSAVRAAYRTLVKSPIDLEHLDLDHLDWGYLDVQVGKLVLEHEDEKFNAVLASRGPKDQVLAAHAMALKQACAEAVRACLWLVSVIGQCPIEAKWDVIEGDGGGAEMIRFGKRSGDLFRAEYLSKL